MSSRVELHEVKKFLNVLISVPRIQRISILKTINSLQSVYILHLAYNILFNTSIPLSPDDRATLKKNIFYIKQLASKRVPLKRKRQILVKKHQLLVKLAKIILEHSPE